MRPHSPTPSSQKKLKNLESKLFCTNYTAFSPNLREDYKKAAEKCLILMIYEAETHRL
jgi:hypothetical protein